MNTKRTASQAAGESQAQDIVALKKRYDKLQTETTRAETKLESAHKELQNLKKEAKKDYGTDELPALQKKLEDMKEQNEKKRAAYQKSLEKIENELQEVEVKYDASKEGSE
jgi:predicted  nucleic acid-binding Zn-ribbon protein